MADFRLNGAIGHAAEMGGRYLNTIAALLVREEEDRRRNPMEALLDLLEPVVLIGMVSVAWWFLNHRNSSPLGGSPALFYATGFFAKYFFIYLSGRMRRIDSPRRRLPVESRLDHIFVHLILRTIDYCILSLLVFGLLYLFVTSAALPRNVLPIVQATIALVMLGFGWGVFNMGMSKAIWWWGYFFPAFNRVMMVLLSGVFFVMDFLPVTVRYVLSFNPIAHAIILFRTGFFPNHPTLVLDTHYLAWCALVAVIFGVTFERLTQRFEHR